MNARGFPLHWLRNVNEVNLQTRFRIKTVHACPLTSKLCAEVWRTGNEFSLNPGKENWKLEMETPKKFPAKIDFDFHWKSSGFPTATSDF